MKIKELPQIFRTKARKMLNQLEKEPKKLIIYYKDENSNNLSFVTKEEYENLKNHYNIEIIENNIK